jgi:tetratricopeptide (TPR) repeat protein
MQAKGVTCSDCHDPHTLELRRPGSDVCAQCHQPAKYEAPAHTHHAKGTPAAECVACHMPTTTYMRIDDRHDHSLRIPRPDLSAALGNAKPDTCHAKKSPQWAADAIRGWTGHAPVGYQAFGEALRAGTAGAPGARGALMTIADDTAQPGIARASALERLGRMLSPSSLPSLTRALNDPDALVRLAAVEGIGTTDAATRLRYLPRMLNDPVRSIRIEAARALAGPTEARSATTERDAFAKALAEYVAVQTYNADRPEGRMNLGNLYAMRGDPERAIAEFRKALEIDATSVEARVNLADLYRTRGVETEAETVLRQGIAKTPRAAPLHYALGLTLVREKRHADGLREFGEAARLRRQRALRYVYAVAQNDAGRTKEALEVLTAASKRHPYDRDLLFGLAHYSAAAGQRDAASSMQRRSSSSTPRTRSTHSSPGHFRRLSSAEPLRRAAEGDYLDPPQWLRGAPL